MADKLLLADGSSKLLLADGSSNLLLAVSAGATYTLSVTAATVTLTGQNVGLDYSPVVPSAPVLRTGGFLPQLVSEKHRRKREREKREEEDRLDDIVRRAYEGEIFPPALEKPSSPQPVQRLSKRKVDELARAIVGEYELSSQLTEIKALIREYERQLIKLKKQEDDEDDETFLFMAA